MPAQHTRSAVLTTQDAAGAQQVLSLLAVSAATSDSDADSDADSDTDTAHDLNDYYYARDYQPSLNSTHKGGGGPGMVVGPTQTRSGSVAAQACQRNLDRSFFRSLAAGPLSTTRL